MSALVPAEHPNDRLEAALAYARHGWRVLPIQSAEDGICSCGRKSCDSPAKHPRTARGLKDATTDERRIRAWWRKWPNANVGIATGAKSGLVVLDADARHGGEESLLELKSRFGPLPDTVQALTGGGGRHLYFQHPGGQTRIRNAVRLLGLPGIDVRGDAGYVVAPPSRHANGREYLWELSSAPDDVPVAPLPPWLLDLLVPPRVPTDTPRHDGSGDNPATDTPYGLAALEAEAQRVRSAAKGTRNDTLNRAAFVIGQLAAGHQLEPHPAARRLLEAALATGLTEREAEATIRSGWRAGRREPREPSPPASQDTSQPKGAPQPGPSPARHRDGYILVPGQHTTDRGQRFEIGNDDFASAVLEALPEGLLYRWDRVVGDISGVPGDRRFIEIGVDRMRLLVDEHVQLAKWLRKRKAEKPARIFVASSRDHAALVLAAAAWSERVRALRLLTHYPVFAEEGLNLVRPGWNAGSRIYYDEPPDLVGLVPERIEPSQIAAFIDDLLVDFPFKDSASKQNFLGLLLTPLLAPAIEGCIPMHLVMASLERTGKGLLISSLLGRGICGRPIPTLQIGMSEEEREKRITSLILEGATVTHLDNIPTRAALDSAALSSLLTSRIWKGRQLGESRTPELPNNLIPVASGNNVRATGEVAKRCVPIWLQPLDDHPEDRADFAHPDIQRYARENRRRLLAILLGLVLAWKEAGQPPGTARLGGFEEWARTIGGILHLAGFDAWMTNYRAWVSVADDWTADAQALAERWWARHGGAPISASDALRLLVSLPPIFPWVTARHESSQLMTFTKGVLLQMVDRPLRGHRLEKERSGNNSLYRMTYDPDAERVANTGHPGGPGGHREVK